MKLNSNLRRSSGGPRRAQAGFSLAELMVVIVIIGLLISVVAPNVMRQLGKGQTGRVKIDVTTLESAIESYQIDNAGRFPESLDALIQPDENGNAYLKADTLPLDPWKNEYQYEMPQPGQNRPTIYSLGSDGQRGGEGDAKDIDNHMIRSGEV